MIRLAIRKINHKICQQHIESVEVTEIKGADSTIVDRTGGEGGTVILRCSVRVVNKAALCIVQKHYISFQ
jgi:hypothetical protein